MGGMGGMGGAGGSAGTGGTGGIPGTGGGGPIACDPNIQIPCYTGPAGTIGIGLCKPGALECAADGTLFGQCTGDVVPVADACGNAADDDCNGATDEFCASWSKRFGASGDQRGLGLAVGADGRIVMVGRMVGMANFGAGALTSAGGFDAFVAKFEPDGTLIWAKRYGSSNDEEARAVAIDPMGNIIVVGNHAGTIGFGSAADPTHTNLGGDDAFVAKLGPDGAYKWSRSFGGANDQYALSVATDATGNVVIGGGYAGDINFGAGLTSTATDWLDGFIIRLDNTGTTVWAKEFGTWGYDDAMGVALAPNGDVLIAGQYDTEVDFGMGSPPDLDGEDMFIARLDPAGNQLSLIPFGGPGDQEPIGAGLTTAGNFVVAGNFSSQIDFGNGPHTSQGGDDLFAVEFDAMGTAVWERTFGGPFEQFMAGMAVNPAGGAAIVGSMQTTLDTGNGPPLVNIDPSSTANDDIFLVNISPDGKTKYAKNFGDIDDQDGRATAIGPDGSIYITGEFAGAMNMGTGTLTSASGDDAYLAKFPP